MPDSQDTLTKSVLIEWLAGVPDDAKITLEITAFGQLDFIVTDTNGHDRILRVGVPGPADDQQSDPKTNDHAVLPFTPRRRGEET